MFDWIGVKSRNCKGNVTSPIDLLEISRSMAGV